VVNTTAAIERQVQEKQAEIKQIVRGAWAAHTKVQGRKRERVDGGSLRSERPALSHAEYTLKVEELQEQAMYDDGAIEAEKKRLKEEKVQVIESFQQKEERCAQLEAETEKVKREADVTASKLDGLVQQRDVKIPEIECAPYVRAARWLLLLAHAGLMCVHMRVVV
jgi:uncharacterized protein (DUF342 family)